MSNGADVPLRTYSTNLKLKPTLMLTLSLT